MEKNLVSALVTTRNKANRNSISSPRFWMLSRWNNLAFWIMQTLDKLNAMLNSLLRKLVLRLQTARLNSVQNQFQFRMLLSQASWTLLVKTISKKMFTNSKIHSQHLQLRRNGPPFRTLSNGYQMKLKADLVQLSAVRRAQPKAKRSEAKIGWMIMWTRISTQPLTLEKILQAKA